MSNDWILDLNERYGFTIPKTVVVNHLYDGSNGLVTPAVCDALGIQQVRSITTGYNATLSTYLEAGVTRASELLTTTTAASRQRRAVWQTGTIASDTYVILADLSTEQFTNYVTVDNISIALNYDTNNSDCTISIGVITRIDASDADISYLISIPFSAANAKTYLSYVNNYQPSGVGFRVDGGLLVNACTNIFETTASVNSSTPLPKPGNASTATPSVGDVIIKFNYGIGDFVSTVQCVYHSD